MSRRLAALTALLASVAALALAGPAGVAAQPLYTGVSNPDPTSAAAMSQIGKTGASFVRIPLGWGPTAPANPPAGWNPADPDEPGYDWAATDDAVRDAVAAGLTPVLQVDGAPTWAQRCHDDSGFASLVCNPDPAALRAFATAAAARYSGRLHGLPQVRYWQAMNEPNLSLFFAPQFGANGKPVSPYLYRDLLNAFYAGVKAVEPSDLVIAAGLGPIAVPKYTIGPLQFARLMLCMKGGKKPKPAKGDCGGGVDFDIFAIHPYTTGGPDHKGHGNDVELGDLKKLQTLVRAADRAGRINSSFAHTPIWITEFSWDSKPPDPGGLPMRIETRWVAEALHRAWSAGVDHFFWFSLRDDPPSTSRPYSETLQSGLYFRAASVAEDQPKPFAGAFRFPFVAYPRHGKLRYWGRTPSGGRGTVKVQLLRGGKWRTVARAKANGAGIFHGTVGTAYGRNQKGAARALLGGRGSASFSMKPVPDFYHPPFG